MTYAIETYNLTKKYGNLIAVDDLNIGVEKGEVFGLLGPNGAGKTTTILMLCTILKPTQGTAKVNGFDIIKEPNNVRKSIGIVFQDPSLDDRLTGRENLEMHAMLYDVPKGVREERIRDVLRLVELEERANSLVRTYSGGMKRRLEIARGLVHHPEVLFLDEPTLGLDPQTREHVWEYIQELNKRENITMILTTHYMDEADRLCDRIAIIDFGKIKALDTSENLKNALEGDVVSVKTKEIEKLAKKLEKLDFIKGINVLDNFLKLTVKNGENLIPRVAEIANKSGIYLESITLHKPTLNDVFLHYTGREIRHEEGESPFNVIFRMRGRTR